jgi:hypothetical protein
MRQSAWFILILVSAASNSSTAQHGCTKAGERPGFYSKLGIILCSQDADTKQRHLEIPSPDGSVILLVDGNDARFIERGAQVGPSWTVGPNEEEIIWSPDSRAVITTLSLGGLGPVTAGIGYVHQETSPSAPDITRAIQKDFASRHPNDPCTSNVNVGGLTWEEGSRKAVFLAEVPSSSSCGRMMGYFEAYVVSIPEGTIVAQYVQKETLKRWRKVLVPEMLDDK